MESAAPYIFAAVVLLVIFVAAVLSRRAAKIRREALAALAAGRGWTFSHVGDYSHDDHFPQFRQFQQGLGRYAYNSILGTTPVAGDELRIKLGDFHYETRSHNSKGHKTTHHHHFSYLLMELPCPGVPELSIRPEGMFDKVGAFFGFDDIDFESSEFSNKFHVKSDDKRFAYDIVHPQMMEFLLATRGPTLVLSEGHALVTKSGVWKPEEFVPHIEWLTMFFDRWPQHVLADLKSRA